MNGRFFRCATRKAHDRDPVTDFAEVGGCTIELDDPTACAVENRVRLETLAVVEIADENLLEMKQADHLGKIRRNCQATLVINACARDGRAMDFRFEQRQLHRHWSSRALQRRERAHKPLAA